MRRTLAVALVPAAVTVAAWVRLEEPHDAPLRVLAVAALALLPALAPSPRTRLAAAAVALALASRLALGAWLDHPGRIVSRFSTGFLDFYEVRVPFDPRVQAEMRGVILTAVFGFVLAVGTAVAARRPVAAVLVILVGAGWPATLAGNAGAVGRGVAILLAALVVLAGLTRRRIPRVALPAVAALAAAAAVVSSSPAVAKGGGLVAWQRWDPYAAPDRPVSVSYVWDAQYGGLSFPAKRTTVLEVKAPAAAPYWRAAVLDVFARDRWVEGPSLPGDGLEPQAARDRRRWMRQDVTVDALSDTRLVGASVPVAFDAGDARLVRPAPGLALLPSGLTRGLRYTVWSYVPQPGPRELARSRARYPASLRPFLAVWPRVTTPAFDTPGRARRMTALLDAHPEIARYAPLEKAALAVAGAARTPYGAAVSLESWFRTRGGFTYTDRPAVFAAAPLVGFVVQTRAGYCQYFAGAMALMLRYLGVPARVAVGFSSGVYDARRGVWTVTDHDAHAWVEAWFDGYGWLPFDPTPAARRPEAGRLSAPYSAASPRFSAGAPVRRAAAVPREAAHRHGEARTAAGQPRVAAATSRRRSLLLQAVLLLVAAVAAIALTKLLVRRTRYLSRDPRRLAAACRRELADFLLDQRLDAARSATLHELGALVRDQLAVEPGDFVAAAAAARFGPAEGAAPAAREARRELRRLLRRIRRRLTAGDRVRGLLSLRSLGFAP